MAAKRILAAATYFGVALFLSIAFVSYDGVSAPDEIGIFANLGGSVGFWAASLLIKCVGVGAFGLSFFLLFVGYSVLVDRPLRSPIAKCIGAVVVMLSIGVVVQALSPESGYARSVFPLGGIAGEFGAHTLDRLFGRAGTSLILLLVGVTGVLLATDVFLFRAVQALPELFAALASGLRPLFRKSALAAERAVLAPEDAALIAEPVKRRTRKPTAADADGGRSTAGTATENAAATDLARPEAEPFEIEAHDLAPKTRGRRAKPVAGVDASGLDAPAQAEDRVEAGAASPFDLDFDADFDADKELADGLEELRPVPLGGPDDGIDDDGEFEEIVPKKKRARAERRRERKAADPDDAPEAPELEALDDDGIETEPAGVLSPATDYDEGGDNVDGGELYDAEMAASSPPERRIVEPVIRTTRPARPTEGIEILKIARSKHFEGHEPYALPPLSMLEEYAPPDNQERNDEIKRKADRISESLATFGVQAAVTEISRGPTITLYELEPAAGTKVSKIVNLADEMAMALRAQAIRIVAPIPGKATVGIEVPNVVREKVSLKELACNDILSKKNFAIPLFLGKDSTGNPLIEDLASMPHLLIAGQTGSGKSVCINSLIASVLLTKYPEEVRLVLIDPKVVELRAFREIPHLYTPVVTDMKKAPKVLEWACSEMDQRYELLAAAAVRDIRSFNELGEEEVKKRLSEHFVGEELDQAPTFMPYIVVIIDELADLMMTSAKEVEGSICRLAQKSRAVGIHVILATQRPSVDVITGLIKANMPSRISFRVASKVDSRTILDQAGADRLVGHGDMLYLPPRASSPIRCQATLVSDHEIENLVKYIKDVARPEYSAELTEVRAPSEAKSVGGSDRDELYDEAVRFVLETRRGSVSMLQRKFEIGYTRAARLVDFMAEDGIVGEFKGSKSREVIKTLEEWEAERAQAG